MTQPGTPNWGERLTQAASRMSIARSSRRNPLRGLAVFVATCGWAGYAPVAPGTVGTLVAVPLFPALTRLWNMSPPSYLLAFALILAGAVWAAGVATRDFGEPDSKHIVIDEVAGYVVATAFLDFSWSAAAVAFCLFRLFDILKPFPVSWVDRHVHGGAGVVGDDVVAGIFAGVAARVLLSFL